MYFDIISITYPVKKFEIKLENFIPQNLSDINCNKNFFKYVIFFNASLFIKTELINGYIYIFT